MKISYLFGDSSDIRNIKIEDNRQGFDLKMTCFGSHELNENGYKITAKKENKEFLITQRTFYARPPLTENQCINIFNIFLVKIKYTPIQEKIKEREERERTNALILKMYAMEQKLQNAIDDNR